MYHHVKLDRHLMQPNSELGIGIDAMYSGSLYRCVASPPKPRGSMYILLNDVLWPWRAFYMCALGPNFLLYGYLDPLGQVSCPEILGAVWELCGRLATCWLLS